MPNETRHPGQTHPQRHTTGFRRAPSGFTLIEVVVAILVLAVGMLAALALTTAGMRWGREVKNQTMALTCARSLIADPTLIDASADPTADGTVSGYVGEFYAVRSAVPVTLEILDGPSATSHTMKDFSGQLSDYAGTFQDVTVELYEGVLGGDTTTGDLVFQVTAKRHHRY